MREPKALGLILRRLEEVSLGTHREAEGHDCGFSCRIDRRIRNLREQLFKIIVEEAGPVRQDGQWLIVPHRSERIFPVVYHRLENEAQVLRGVAEHPKF